MPWPTAKPAGSTESSPCRSLTACAQEGRVWLTCDQRTIPDLLRQWAAEQRPHAGVVFGDRHTVPPNDAGAVAAALVRLVFEIANADTTNLIRHLRNAGE